MSTKADSISDLRTRMADLAGEFPGLIEAKVALRTYASFGVGGSADLFAKAANMSDLQNLIKAAVRHAVPYVVIGGGTNLLVGDLGVRGLVIRNELMGISRDGSQIRAMAGEDFMSLVNAATGAGLTGMEFAAGIWGTVGGAVVGNAGAYGAEICDVLVSIEILDRAGEPRTELVSYFQFAYRDSLLKRTGETVISATVELRPGNQVAIQTRVDEILAIRAQKHPRIPNSAGSFFKNIPDPSQPYGKLPAGRLLDEVGAKGMKVGGATVYEKHANILINSDQATAKDIRELADMLKRKAFERHGIMLQEEVVALGEFE